MRSAYAIALLILAAAGAQADAQPVYYLDISNLNGLSLADPGEARKAWDTAHLAASIQGIVNRSESRLFLRFMPDPDDFWFDHMKSDGQWLAGREVRTLNSVEELLKTFDSELKGIVVYDDRVYATSNLASTIAGVEDRICLRHDPNEGSVYSMTMKSGLSCTKDVKRLMNDDGSPMFTGRGTIPGTDISSSGSAKCDAYLWAKHFYLDAGKCSPEYMAYYLDAFWLTNPTESGFPNATLTNHDFFISKRAFFFDLHVWEEESPVDDPNQKPGTDVETLRALLKSMYQQSGGKIIYIGGFTPWAWKYTDFHAAGSKHGGVDTEWKYAKIISAYNGIMDADALGLSGMANASFYQHYPLKERYPQNKKPTVDDLRTRGLIQEDGSVAPHAYVCFYMGDYDSAAWLNANVPKWWQDPAHGETLCTWAFNPNLDRRAPQAIDYVRTHQSPNDWFMFGDSGAGYLNPGMLVAPREDSGLPDGLDAWVAHNKVYADRYDLSITGFIIDGHSPGMGEKGMDAYMRFSPDGIVGQKIPPQGVYKDTMPYIRMKLDLYGTPEEAGSSIASLVGLNVPKFMFIRTILQSPSWHKAVMEKAKSLAPNLEFVDPYTFFLLLKTHELGKQGAKAPENPLRQVSFRAPREQRGLVPVSVPDGPFERCEENGEGFLRLKKSDDYRYLYFEASDAFSRPLKEQKNAEVVVTVGLKASEAGELGIHFDTKKKDYAEGPKVTISKPEEWTEAVFVLLGARFAHTQNGGADFRLVYRGMNLEVRHAGARIEPKDRIKAFCVDFNWGSQGFAAPGLYTQASPQKHFEWYRDMGVNTIQTFCVSCPGYAWYRSEVAPVQPGMEGDFLKELVDLGHAGGMRVMGYFCIGANAYWSETHPDEVHNQPNSISIPFTRTYLDYLGRVISEAVSKTGIDGFMIDWVYNASHFYKDKSYQWLDCEKQMYQELFSQPFPGNEAMTQDKTDEFNRRATERCWNTIRDAAKSANPNVIIWLTCFDLQHPILKASRMLKEVDWLMNEHPDTKKLDEARAAAGPHTKLIQCICGWGDQHDAARILADPEYAGVGMYGFAKPDEKTTLPLDDGSGNARNIAAIRKSFKGQP